MGDAFGKYGRTFLQICVLVSNVSVLIVNMIIIGMTSFHTTELHIWLLFDIQLCFERVL